MSDLSPEELVLWCQRTLPDDTRAFEVLVAHFKRSVFATAYRLMGNREEAEDQAQEAFIKIYRGIIKLKEPATLAAWIQRVTINTCLDALSKQKRRPQHISITSEDDGEGQHHAAAHTGSPHATAESGELRRCLERALSVLEPEGRQVIVLRDIEAMPYEEIAAALKLKLSAVKMRIHRARLAFQKLLEKTCPGVAESRSARA